MQEFLVACHNRYKRSNDTAKDLGVDKVSVGRGSTLIIFQNRDMFAKERRGQIFRGVSRRGGNTSHIAKSKPTRGTCTFPPSATLIFPAHLAAKNARSRRSSERCIGQLAALGTDFLSPNTSPAISTRRYRVSRSNDGEPCHPPAAISFFFFELASRASRLLRLLQLKSRCYVSVKNITLFEDFVEDLPLL